MTTLGKAGLRCAVMCGLLLSAHTTHAQPRTPSHDDEVLERVSDSVSVRTLAALRSSDARKSPELTEHIVRAQLKLATRSGDPRFLGYAQAALANWWTDVAPPPRIALVRAEIKQKRHEFKSALADF